MVSVFVVHVTIPNGPGLTIRIECNHNDIRFPESVRVDRMCNKVRDIIFPPVEISYYGGLFSSSRSVSNRVLVNVDNKDAKGEQRSLHGARAASQMYGAFRIKFAGSALGIKMASCSYGFGIHIRGDRKCPVRLHSSRALGRGCRGFIPSAARMLSLIPTIEGCYVFTCMVRNDPIG